MQRAIITKQPLCRYRAIGGHRDLRQQIIDQRLLPGTQRFALAAAVKPVERGGIAFLMCTHARAVGIGHREGQAARCMAASREAAILLEAAKKIGMDAPGGLC